MSLSSTMSAIVAANRFGFAPKPGELKTIAADARGWVAAQLNHGGELQSDLPSAQQTVALMLEARKEKEERPEIQKRIRQTYLGEIDLRMRAAITGETPLLERLTQFWSNHFTVSGMRPIVRGATGAFEREAIRPHILGRFSDLLLAVTRHPVMLLYLDNVQSMGPDSMGGMRRNKGINENLGRELLELHTLGVDGGYTQADVTSLSRILTGWSISRLDHPEPGGFHFYPALHEPGAKTLLGRTYQEAGFEEGEAALRDLAAHPSTARHIAVQLARHFIADVPPADAVERIARTYRESGGDLRRVTLAVVKEDAAWSAPFTKVRAPTDLLIAAYRAVGEIPKPEVVFRDLKRMEQPPFFAPSPAGWPDAAAQWISPETVVQRTEWCQTFAQSVIDPPDPLETMNGVFGDALPEETQQAVRRAPSKRVALALLIASPQFQRR